MTEVLLVCLGDVDAKILRAVRDGLPTTRAERQRAATLRELGLWAHGTPLPDHTPDHLTAEGIASLAYFDDCNAA